MFVTPGENLAQSVYLYQVYVVGCKLQLYFYYFLQGERTASTQALYQFIALAVTLVLSVVSGFFTGDKILYIIILWENTTFFSSSTIFLLIHLEWLTIILSRSNLHQQIYLLNVSCYAQKYLSMNVRITNAKQHNKCYFQGNLTLNWTHMQAFIFQAFTVPLLGKAFTPFSTSLGCMAILFGWNLWCRGQEYGDQKIKKLSFIHLKGKIFHQTIDLSHEDPAQMDSPVDYFSILLHKIDGVVYLFSHSFPDSNGNVNKQKKAKHKSKAYLKFKEFVNK